MRPLVTRTSRTAGQGGVGGCGAGCANEGADSAVASAIGTIKARVLVGTLAPLDGDLCPYSNRGRRTALHALTRYRSIAHGAADRQRVRHGLALRAQGPRPVAQMALAGADGA